MHEISSLCCSRLAIFPSLSIDQMFLLQRDPAHMIRFFKQCFVETTFAIMQSANFPSYVWANENVENVSVFISSLCYILKFTDLKI